jgi:hypothetical protein
MIPARGSISNALRKISGLSEEVSRGVKYTEKSIQDIAMMGSGMKPVISNIYALLEAVKKL